MFRFPRPHTCSTLAWLGILALSFGSLTRAAEPTAVGLSYLVIDDGLCSDEVRVMIQDPLGYLWVGTKNGLNRYDGYDLDCFSHDPDDPDSLSSDDITTLMVDSDGDLWAGTWGGGLNRFEPDSLGFTRFLELSTRESAGRGTIISCLFEDSCGRMWVGSVPGGLLSFDRQTGSSRVVLPVSSSGDQIRYVTDVTEDSLGRIWVALMGEGVRVLDAEGNELDRLRHDPGDPAGLTSDDAWFVHEDHGGSIWIGTQDGLNRYDPRNGWLTRFHADSDDPGALIHGDVRTCMEDRTGQLWLGTWGGGVSIVDPISATFSRPGPADFGEKMIRDIFEDETGILWFGTWENGLIRYDPFQDMFDTYRHDPDDPGSLGDSEVWSILEDQTGMLWVGHEKGLDRLMPGDQGFTHYRYRRGDPETLAGGAVNSLYREGDSLWIGAWIGGLCRLDIPTGKVTRYPVGAEDGFSSSGPKIKDIVPTGDGDLWLFIHGRGIDRFDPETGRFTYYRVDPTDPDSLISAIVWCGVVEGPENLWAGTDRGLARLDVARGRFDHFHHEPDRADSLSNSRVYSLLRTRDGTLWVGTSNGLSKMVGEDRFISYRKGKGRFPDDTINGLLEDQTGNIWFSTEEGLVEMDPGTETFRHYDLEDGLQGRVYRIGAAFASPTGRLYFGGTNGLDTFDPGESLIRNQVPPTVVLTNLQLFNDRVGWGADELLPAHINTLDELVLDHNQNNIAFEFTAPSLRDPRKTRYMYIMEGAEKEWVYRDASLRLAPYSNLSSGSYRFRVRAANDDGLWSEEEASIEIRIKPPLLLSPLAYVCYALIAIAVIRASVLYIRRRQLETILRREKEAAEIANLAKSRFLSNMSHELRTPLNAILGFTQLMRHDDLLSGENKRNLDIINTSGEHLLTVINDVLEMSKIEAGNLTLHPGVFDLSGMIRALEQMFGLRANEKGLALDFTIQPDVPEQIFGDEGKIRQILTNLLSNALKFTEDGEISLCASVERDGDDSHNLTLFFRVADTGAGISPEEQAELFSPFVQSESGRRSQQGTGLGLSISRQLVRLMGGDMTLESEVGRGTCFSFHIRCREAFADEAAGDAGERAVIGIASGSRRRVLVVDDHAGNREVVVRLLAPVGFEVREADGGAAALRIVAVWRPDLVFLDKRMTGMSGVETTRRLRARAREGEPMVILALTASAFDDDRRDMLEAGCDDIVTKPFREATLMRVIARHLGLRYRYEERAAMEPEEPLDATDPGSPALAALPHDLQQALKDATVLGDLDLLSQIIDRIEREVDAGLAKMVRELVDGFAFETILTRLGEARRATLETSRG